MRKLVLASGFTIRSDTNRALMSHNFNIYGLELKKSDLGNRGIVLCHENKGADQPILLAYAIKHSHEAVHFGMPTL